MLLNSHRNNCRYGTSRVVTAREHLMLLNSTCNWGEVIQRTPCDIDLRFAMTGTKYEAGRRGKSSLETFSKQRLEAFKIKTFWDIQVSAFFVSQVDNVFCGGR